MPTINGEWVPQSDVLRAAREAREDRRACVDPALGYPIMRFVGPYSCVVCRGEVEPWSICPAGGHSCCDCPRTRQSSVALYEVCEESERTYLDRRFSYGGIAQ